LSRNEELTIVEFDGIHFNGVTYTRLEVPLSHINFDNNGNQRSEFNAEEICKLVFDALEGKFIDPAGKKRLYEYFVYIFEEKTSSKNFKIVFMTEDNTIYIRIITLFRVR